MKLLSFYEKMLMILLRNLPFDNFDGFLSYYHLKKALITRHYRTRWFLSDRVASEKDYEVHGIVRRSSSFNRWRIDHLIQDPAIYGKKLFLHYADLRDDASLRRIFSKTKPDEFYHLAGQSHVG